MNTEAPRRAGPGRPKGLRNVVTRTMKSLTLGALDAVGGQKHLEKMATSKVASDRAAFMALLGRLVPLEVAGQLDAALSVTVVKCVIGRDGNVVESEIAAPDLPLEGTFPIGKNGEHLPLPAPIDAKSE